MWEASRSRSLGSAVGRLPWCRRDRSGLVIARTMRAIRDRRCGSGAASGAGRSPASSIRPASLCWGSRSVGSMSQNAQ